MILGPIAVVVFASVVGAGDEVPASLPASAEVQVVANRTAVPGSTEAPAPASEERAIGRRVDRVAARSHEANAAAAERSAASVTDAGWPARVRELVPLALVLLIIGGLTLVARRFVPREWRIRAGNRGVIEVLARQQISPKQSIILVKVGRRAVLVGSAPDRLTCLDTITDADEVALLVGRSGSAGARSLTGAFEREILREVASYDPQRQTEDGEGKSATVGRAADWAAAREQVRSLLSRVRSFAASA